MSYEFNTPVAVTTVNDNNYPRPKLVNGQWVVSASAVRKEPNKVVLYNPTTRITTPVTPYTVSIDYYNQVKRYENNLAKMQAEQDEIRRLYADTTDPTQVNSFADVITAGDERFARQLNNMFTTGQPANVFSWIGDKGKAFGELLKNMLIDPVLHKDIPILGKEGKAAMLFNNALVNLSETMDYFTLTSVVKSYLIGASEDKTLSEMNKDAMAVFGDVYGSGRRQQDWNVQTGSAIGNTIVNTILEVLSDPTTWISFGTSSAIKSAARPQVSHIIRQSFDDIGIKITTGQADNIAKGALRTFVYGDASLAEAVSKVHIGRGLQKQATATQIELFYHALKKNANLLTETKNMHLLRSIYGASEGMQKLATKTVGYTSALGWGFHAVKGALKGGLEVLPYAVSKINNIIKDVDVDNITLKNLPEHMVTIEGNYNTLRDVVGLADDFPQQAVAQATHAFQEMKYIELKNIINKVKSTPSAKVLSELNEWAGKAGFDDVFDMLQNLLRVKTAVPSDLRKMVYEIGNTVTQLLDNAIIETINPVVAVLDKNILSKMVPTEYTGIIEQLTSLKGLGITDLDFSSTLYDDSIAALTSIKNLFEHSEQRGLNAYIQEYNILKDFDMFTYDDALTERFTTFSRDLNRYVSVDVPVLDLDIATADALREALQALDAHGELSNIFTDYTLDILNMLNAWDEGVLSVRMVDKTNNAMASLKRILNAYNQHALNELVDVIDINTIAQYEPSINALRVKLTEFIENKVKISRTPINETALFTDTIVGKAADTTAGNVVLEGLTKLARDKGMSTEDVNKLYTQLINYNTDVLLDANSPAVKDAFEHVTAVAEYLKEMDIGSYYIRELGLYEAIDDWASNGFTVGFGEDLLTKIDQAIYNMRNKIAPDTLDPITDMQLLRDDIQDLINIGNQTIEQRVKMTQELMSSRLYEVKLSHIQALTLLLNTEYVQEMLTNVRYSTNIGQLFDALSDATLSSDLAEAVGHVQGLAKSVYIANQTIELIRKSNLPDVWKDGLYDTLAGYTRAPIYELGNANQVASTWLTKAKVFIDNINHAHAPRFNELNYSGDTLSSAEYLHKAIFAPLSIDPREANIKIVSEYWEGIGKELLKDGENYFNVVYSAGQTGYKSGTIYEFSFVLPNGDSMKYVDNSMREMVLQTLDNQTARKLYGKSKKEVVNNMLDIMRKEANNPNVKVFYTTEEFAEAMFDLFKNIKTIARNNKLSARLVGFNTAVDSFSTDQLLSRFMSYNRLNTHIQYSDVEFKNMFSIGTFDAAQFLRIKEEGAVTITNDMLSEVTEIVRNVKVYLEEANGYTAYARGQLVPDFNTTATASLREVLAALDNTIEIMIERSKRPRDLLAGDFRDITQAQFNLLINSFSLNQLQGFRTELSNVIQNIGATLLNIKQSNNALGQYVLIQEAIAKYTGEANVMAVLNKYFVQPGGVPAFSYKKVYDPDIFTEWFGTNRLNAEDLYTFTKMQDIADRLQRTKAQIKHPLLIMDLDNEQLKQTVQALKAQFITTPNYRYSAWAKEVIMLDPSNNQINNYIMAKFLWDNIKKVSDIDTLNTVSEAIKREIPNGSLILYYTQMPEETIMFNEPLYIAGVDVLHSELIKDSNYIMQLTREIEEVTNVKERTETLYDALFLDQRIRDERGLNLPSLRIKEQFIKTYTDFIDNVQAEFNIAYEEYFEELMEATSQLEKFALRKAYTAKVEEIISELDELSFGSAQRRANFIMSLTPESYAKFLYKYSQGVQMFDMTAEIFQDTSNLLGTFMHTLKDGERFGIKYIEDVKNKQMFVYLDKNIINLEHMTEVTKDFILNTPKQYKNIIGSSMQNSYYEFADIMDDLFDGSYSVSMHRTMNNTRFKELLDYIPTQVKDNMLTLEYLDEHDLIEGLFNQTIVGDYASGLNTVFSVYSGNIVTNVAAGFNVAFNRLRGKDMYTTLIFNPKHSLKTWLDNVGRLGKVTQEEVVEAITKNNYVVTELKDGKIKSIDIRKPKEYARALKEGAALLDYHTHMHSVEVINTVKYNNKMSKIINKYLGIIKIGQLMSFGWLLRNIPDSAIKGWIQSGLDPMYIASSFTRTRKIMAQYNTTYAAVFKETGGNLSPKNVADFFIKNTNTELLEEGLFRKLLTFYSNSASVPTAAQLSLDRDLITKLFNRVKGNEEITRGHVKKALEIFKETASTDSPFKNAYDSLRNLYSDDITTTLILLRKYVPEKELKKARAQPLVDKLFTSNYIMRANNSIESFIRTHTFLYHSVYNDGSIAGALKAVDLSQFNRSRDSKATRMMEHLLPFSTFQMDNFLFWEDVVKQGKGNILSLSENILNGMYDEEQLDIDELSRNMSLQYLYMSGNIIIDDETGMSLKLNDSLHSVLQLITSPVEYISDMLNVPLEVMRTLTQAILADEEEYAKSSFGKVKPISQWEIGDYTDEMIQLIPLVGVIYQRYTTAWDKYQLSDMILPLVFPSIFGITKLDSAGTTYHGRPIGFDWYNQSQEYKNTHRYVFGVSYVPSWMNKDPKTYANTLVRLQNMGYPKEMALEMMQHGWYIKAPNYQLKKYTPYIKYPKRTYAPRPQYADKTYARPTYYKYVKNVKKPKTFVMKSSKPYYLESDRIKTTDRNHVVRRIYRPTMYNDRFTRTGVSRETLIKWRGPNRSSRQLLRDRSAATRRRMQRIQRQVRPL